MTFFDHYYHRQTDSAEKPYKKDIPFQQWVKSQTQEREINGKMKPMNVTIEIKVQSYERIAQSVLRSLSDSQLAFLVKSYSLRQFIERHPLKLPS